ncbi:MAG TPA: hypothetical protein VFK44_13910 [Bacillales bacterium]|nr:hypothetical protein [Bacillales bacterium]
MFVDVVDAFIFFAGALLVTGDPASGNAYRRSQKRRMVKKFAWIAAASGAMSKGGHFGLLYKGTPPSSG